MACDGAVKPVKEAAGEDQGEPRKRVSEPDRKARQRPAGGAGRRDLVGADPAAG